MGAAIIALSIRGRVSGDAVLTATAAIVCVLIAIFLNPQRSKPRTP
jgi:hypothetical protein